ncbi:MAG: DUF262 domain-containing HNH endonuclease family protein [Muribaculaceae bacterium]|nr:DUF262 domain-containing HNH endonuclease family protein [Muribaculaceae bacterium]
MIKKSKQEIATLTIKDLLSKDRYRIPIYQRNYDWGEKEALQLIEDIADYASSPEGKKYYIGSLVVYEKRDHESKIYYETIDGQQRLTTLSILLCVLKNINSKNWDNTTIGWFEQPNLSYDHRNEADMVIEQLTHGKKIETEYSGNIIDVYQIIAKNIIPIVEKHDLSLDDFCTYLLNNVIILRVPVPVDTQLNHYFEIMNSRGEQLEKHEVLKANLMSYLDASYHDIFRDIWEACSDMDSYVQMRMKSNLRTLIFNNWEDLNYTDIEDIYIEYCHLNDDKQEEETIKPKSITELVAEAKNNKHYPLPSNEDNSPNSIERFGSIINFPNFLLHVLKIYYHNYEGKDDIIDSEIMLDDKRLIDMFLKAIKSIKEREQFVKGFIMELLRVRTLFDRYVIKRENYNNKEGWSLKRLKNYGQSKVNYVSTFNADNGERFDDNDVNKEIRMLQAMFHVSAPTQIYKYWLQAVLYFVSSRDIVCPNDFKEHLISLAKSYMLDRYLNFDEEKKLYFKTKFFDVIYHHDFMPYNQITDIDWENLNQGCGVENFIFNFYDYITWKFDPSKYPTFEFTYRTSVEHFYPQHPGNDHPNLKDKGLDDFGNLCLISRGMNSKFSNNMPLAKLANFGNENEVLLSIKLQEMMEIVRSEGYWDEKSIAKFQQFAINKIENFLKE